MEPAIREILERERPDWALVLGDTNTTAAGARAAVAVGVPGMAYRRYQRKSRPG